MAREKNRIGCVVLVALLVGGGIIPAASGLENDEESVGCGNQSGASLRNIMVTGYWNPTGKMIASFSNNTYLNPDGWKGANWKGYGYNVYSYFPTPGTYNGTLEVDYQDTWNDFWNITEEINPIAIISFGSGRGPWEIEYNARNLERWINDEEPPYQPTPCPPDDTVSPGYTRHSTLPVTNIANVVNNQTSISAWVDWSGDPGAYLCEYMAYLGMWYQALHNTTDDPHPCRSAGFIHVRSSVPLDAAKRAANLTIEEAIKYLLAVNNPPDAPHITGPSDGQIREEYEYTFSASDPEGDPVYYYIEWGGDCPSEEWIGPYDSGEKVTITNSWENKGTYTIAARAKDAHNATSESGTLEVSMPKVRHTAMTAFIEAFIGWFRCYFGTLIISCAI